MEILNLFGVDWKLMLAQLVNFGIVILVLWFFAIKPLKAAMAQRSEEIAKGLADAKMAAQKLDDSENQAKLRLQEAKQSAAEIINQAKKNAEEARVLSLEKTKQDIEGIIAKAKSQISAEKENMAQEVKKEVADLVIASVKKILMENLSASADHKYVEKVIKSIK